MKWKVRGRALDRSLDEIIIHCAATRNGELIGRPGRTMAAAIDEWHAARAFRRTDANRALARPALRAVGYHYLIDVDGVCESGRAPWEIGAHVKGRNARSLGICLAGTDKFTPEQWAELERLVRELMRCYGITAVSGHNQYANKLCPGFSVPAWIDGGMKPLDGHVWRPNEK